MDITIDFDETGFLRTPVAVFEPGDAQEALDSVGELDSMGIPLLALVDPGPEDLDLFGSHRDFLHQPCFVHWRKKARALEEELSERSDLDAKRRKRRVESHERKLARSASYRCTVEPVANGFGEWYEVYERSIIAMRDGWGYRGMAPDSADSEEFRGGHVGVYLREPDGGTFLGGYIVETNRSDSILKIKAGAFHPDEPYARSHLTHRALHVLNDYALSEGYDDLSYGHDSNFYGEYLTTGLARFKLSNGFKPECWRAAHHPEAFVRPRVLKRISANGLRPPFLSYQFGEDRELVPNVAGDLPPDFPLADDCLRTL